MNKVVRDDKVAVLYSPGFGAGWTTWGAPDEMLFDPEVVELVEKGQHAQIESVLEARGFDFYMGGADKLRIEWVPVGMMFKVIEYDGNEGVEYRDADDWKIA